MKRSKVQKETAQGVLILERMKEAAESPTDAALAAYLGVPQATLASWRRRGSIPQWHIKHFAGKQHVSLDWLMSGRGARQPKPLTLPSIDGDLLAIAIDRAERWWREFDDLKRPARASQLAHVICPFYDETTRLFDEVRKTGQLPLEDAVAAVRRAYRLPEDPGFCGPWGDGDDLKKQEYSIRDQLRALSAKKRLPPRKR